MNSPPPDPHLPPGKPPEATSFLARGARGGDRESFGALYERFAPAIHTWARLRIRGPLQGRLDPADVVQDVWMRASEKLDAFDPAQVPFRAWIFAVAKNVLLEATRRVVRPDAAAGGSTMAGALANVPEEITGISLRAARDENLARFVERVLALPEEDRMLVIHCGFEGLTTAEAAPRLGLSPDAAKKRWQRLRQRLEERGFPADLLAAAEV